MNETLFREINGWAGQYVWLDKFMIFSADWLGYVMIAVLAGAFLIDRKKYQDTLIVSLGAAILSRFVLVEIIRFFYNNPRPFLVLSDVVQLVNHETTPSFPSGHASFYFALATGVYLYNKKAGLLAQAGYVYLALAGLMGFARIFSGVHWPLDILGGAVLGAVTAFLAYRLLKKRVPSEKVPVELS